MLWKSFKFKEDIKHLFLTSAGQGIKIQTLRIPTLPIFYQEQFIWYFIPYSPVYDVIDVKELDVKHFTTLEAYGKVIEGAKQLNLEKASWP